MYGDHDDPTKMGRGKRRKADALLVFWDGGSQTHELAADARLVFGRADDCDVCVPHESVSRAHAVLTGSAGSWTVEDLGSSNGTFVAGVRLTRGVPRAVAPGTVVMLGDARFVLDPGAAVTETEQAEAGASLDAPMERTMRLVSLVADSVLPVLLLGETGVGKGRLAEEIHARSARTGAFVRLNCAAVPEPLLESELFGHERGAFTGAVRAKPGILETADLGTVFLDEIGEVPRSTQAKLLHVLEHNEVVRVGATKARAIDVRFLAATNRDLETLVADGAFRRDLYFRLAGIPLHIPALRERTSEVPAMVRSFIEEASSRAKRPVPAISKEAMHALVTHPWPGNIRELRNVVMRAALLAAGGVIAPEHLMLEPVAAPSGAIVPGRGPTQTVLPPPAGGAGGSRLATDLRELERKGIAEALERFDGHQGKAAEYLGVSRRTLTNKLTELELPRPRKR